MFYYTRLGTQLCRETKLSIYINLEFLNMQTKNITEFLKQICQAGFLSYDRIHNSTKTNKRNKLTDKLMLLNIKICLVTFTNIVQLLHAYRTNTVIK